MAGRFAGPVRCKSGDRLAPQGRNKALVAAAGDSGEERLGVPKDIGLTLHFVLALGLVKERPGDSKRSPAPGRFAELLLKARPFGAEMGSLLIAREPLDLGIDTATISLELTATILRLGAL